MGSDRIDRLTWTEGFSPMNYLISNSANVTFMHGTATNPGGVESQGDRSIRICTIAGTGYLGIERRKRIMPIHITGERDVTCYLNDEALASGYAAAQDVAPVASLKQMGITKAPPATTTKATAPIAAFLAPSGAKAPVAAAKIAKVAKIAKIAKVAKVADVYVTTPSWPTTAAAQGAADAKATVKAGGYVKTLTEAMEAVKAMSAVKAAKAVIDADVRDVVEICNGLSEAQRAAVFAAFTTAR